MAASEIGDDEAGPQEQPAYNMNLHTWGFRLTVHSRQAPTQETTALTAGAGVRECCRTGIILGIRLDLETFDFGPLFNGMQKNACARQSLVSRPNVLSLVVLP